MHDSSGAFQAPLPPLAPPSVLIVDDDEDMRVYLRGCLRVMGARLGTLLEAAEGQSALELARTHRPALVIADIVMPRLDGIALARHLAAEPCPPAVLLISGQVTAADLAEARAAARLEKPFTGRELRGAVAALLEAGAGARQPTPSDRALRSSAPLEPPSREPEE